MKKIIVGTNQTLEIPEHLDVDVYSTIIKAKNTWEIVGGSYYRILPGDRLLCAHVYGENTAATPFVLLHTKLNDYDYVAPDTDLVQLRNNSESVMLFEGAKQINHIFNFNNLLGSLYGQFARSNLNVIIDNSANFTGYLNVDFYILKGSR